ncbi:uncharacterized protein LOC116422010 [Sarcophilus harrisii]|uniref:uncharacterized protein LOC116422010 n=1 Tax=Sarcophilus harrisii TaxID=9305 RepID=UPI001301E30D|nr:uncharacterized protein LOC116422010 [Sarcophilus harrisii]
MEGALCRAPGFPATFRGSPKPEAEAGGPRRGSPAYGRSRTHWRGRGRGSSTSRPSSLGPASMGLERPLGGCSMDSEQFPMQKPGVSPASPPPSRPPLQAPGSPGAAPPGPALSPGAPEELLQALLLERPKPAAPSQAGPSGDSVPPSPGRLPAPPPDPE